MKKIGLVLMCVMLIMMMAVGIAEDYLKVYGGREIEDAVLLNGEQFGQIVVADYDNSGKRLKERQNEGWYCFKINNNGICTVRLNKHGSEVCWVDLLDHNGNRLERDCLGSFSNKGWTLYTFEAKEGEQYYLHFTSNDGFTTKWGYMFSVCANGKHQITTGEKVVLEATCIVQGAQGYQCDLCGENVISNSIPAKGHQPGIEQVIRQATCLNRGEKAVLCNDCGIVISSTEIPLTGHVAGAYVDVRPVTCTSEGIRAQYCQICNAALNSETVAPLGHSVGEWKQVQMETCTEIGIREKRCTICGVVTATEEVPMKGHLYSEWKTTLNPTKEAEGEQTRMCANCADIQVEKIPKIAKFLGIF